MMAIGATLLALSGPDAGAAEGMWQPRQMPSIADRLASAGYAGEPAAIADLGKYPMNAVVSIGGCTASFVSAQGLVATNHHCAYGAIQYNSSGERNLLRDGFLAADRAGELPGDPNLRVFVTDRISDVSAEVIGAIEGAGGDPRAVYDAFESKSKDLVRTCESGGSHRCELYTFHGGLEFNLIRQLQIKDVRLVYAPRSAIGKFGGDVDNWMWPRHTGDFAFLRAYVGKNGKPAVYSRDNVPYRPASWLRVAPAGVAAGDYVMVAGYPGRTNRWRLAEELGDAIGWSMPHMIEDYRSLIETIETATAGRADAAVKYASALAGLNNTGKNFQGQLEGFSRIDGVGSKQAQEKALSEWLAARGDGEGQSALAALREALAQSRERRERNYRFGMIAPFNLATSPRFNREGSLIAAALDLHRLSIERGKPDARRSPGYQARDEMRIRARLQMLERRFDPAADRALLGYRLRRYAALPALQRVAELDAWLGIRGDAPDLNGINARLDAFYAGTRLADAATRMSWLGASPARIESADDTALQLAVALRPAIQRIEAEGKFAAGTDLLLRPRFMRAMIDFQASQGRPVYPDANGTLRVTYGNVVGYSPRDAVQYAPFTTLAGIVEKDTGVAPFDTPKSQLAAIRAGQGRAYAARDLGEVPVNFLADLDITGGNSGSPSLNARGELVGLVFDGNWESVSANWIFNPALTRSIHVDIRYMLWVMDEVDRAEHLIREMGLVPASP